jgi:hypothetical protein
MNWSQEYTADNAAVDTVHQARPIINHQEKTPSGSEVAVGMPVTRHPPHRPVLALLTHTIPTSDIGILSVEAYIRIGMQDCDRRNQAA